MNIIKMGRMSWMNKTEKFVCDRCGCVFEAGDNEFLVVEKYAVITCPCCNAVCSKEQKSEG